MSIYIPNQNDIIHETSVDFVLRPCAKEIHIVQYDKSLPVVKVELFKNGERYVLPEDAVVNIRVGKLDRTFVYMNVLGTNSDRNIVYFEINEQMATIPGKIWPVLEVIYNNKVACSSPMCFIVERNPIQDDYIESESYFPIIYELQGTVANHEARITSLEAMVSGDVVNLHDRQVIDGEKIFYLTQGTNIRMEAFHAYNSYDQHLMLILDTGGGNGNEIIHDQYNLQRYHLYFPFNSGTIALESYVDAAIEGVEIRSDVIDVVGTYQDLQNYDTSDVRLNDLIKVISDSTHSNAISYYRWESVSGTNQWVYVASEGPFYTITQVDSITDSLDERKLELHIFDGFKEGTQIEDQIQNGQKIYCPYGRQADFDPTDNPLIEFTWTVSGTKRPVYFKSLYIQYVNDSDGQTYEFNQTFTANTIPSGADADGASFTIDGRTFILQVVPFSSSDVVKISSFDTTKGVHVGTTSLAANIVKLQTTSFRNCTIKAIRIETSGAGTASGSTRTLTLTVGNDQWSSNGSTSISFTTSNASYSWDHGTTGTHIGSGEGEVRIYEHIFIKKSSSGVVSTENANPDYMYMSSDELRLYRYFNNTMNEVSKTRLGTTSDTAYRGDYGQDNYNQIQAIKSQTYTFSGEKTFNGTVITKNSTYLAGTTIIYTGQNTFTQGNASLMICLDEPGEEWMSIGLGGRREINGLNNIITHSSWVEEADQYISDTFYFDGASEVSYSEGSPRTPFPNGSAKVGVGKLYLNSLDSKLSIAWGNGQYDKTNGVILVGHDGTEGGPITLARFYGSSGSIRFASLLRNASDSASRYSCEDIYAGSPWISTPPLISRYGLNIPDTSEYTEERYVATTYDISQSLQDYVVKNSSITGATKCKITYDSKGLVTGGADLAASDIPDLSATYVALTGNQTISGTKTFNGNIITNGDFTSNGPILLKNGACAINFYKSSSSSSTGAYIRGVGDGDNIWLYTSNLYLKSGATIYDGSGSSAQTITVAQIIAKYTKPSGGIPASDLAQTYVIANTAITGATKCKITYDSKGLVTGGADLAASDIPSLDTSKITSGTFADARIASASTWNAKTKVNLNGSDVTTATIYAPITAGTSGQVLQSNGANAAPTWVDAPATGVTSITGGTGLSPTTATSGDVTISIASGYKLLTTSEYNTLSGKYSKPSGGIPSSDLASSILKDISDAVDYTSGGSIGALMFTGGSVVVTRNLDLGTGSVSFYNTNQGVRSITLNPAIQGSISPMGNTGYNLLSIKGSSEYISGYVKVGVSLYNYAIVSDSTTDDSNYRLFKLPTKSAGTYTLLTTSEIGVAGGVAGLDSNGIVPTSQLPAATVAPTSLMTPSYVAYASISSRSLPTQGVGSSGGYQLNPGTRNCARFYVGNVGADSNGIYVLTYAGIMLMFVCYGMQANIYYNTFGPIYNGSYDGGRYYYYVDSSGYLTIFSTTHALPSGYIAYLHKLRLY